MTMNGGRDAVRDRVVIIIDGSKNMNFQNEQRIRIKYGNDEMFDCKQTYCPSTIEDRTP
jgi:hypothetical protein